MAYQFYIQGTPTADVSDYVTDCSEFPYYARNEDYSIISDGMSFKLTRAYTDAFTTSSFDVDDKVLIYSSSVLLYNGKISRKTYNYSSLEYEFEVEQDIQDLKNYTFSFEDMYHEMSASYCEGLTVYDSTFKKLFIKIDKVYEFIFSKLGYTLDFTTRVSETLSNVPYLSGSYSATSTPCRVTYTETSKNMAIQDLYFYLFQLFSVNQPYAVSFTKVDDEPFRSNRISLYDLLSRLNTITRYIFIPKSSTSYYVTNNRTNPQRSVLYEQEFSDYTQVPKAEGVKLEYILPKKVLSSTTFYAWYTFIPWAPPYTGNWYEGTNEIDSFTFTTSYNTVSEPDISDIEWYNNLILWELPSRGGSDHHANMFWPSLNNGYQGLFNGNVVSLLGNGYFQEYENRMNTEKVTAVENYMAIDIRDGGKIVSKIKTAQFTL